MTDMADPTTVRRILGECRAPFLIGVRHHSAVMARAMPGLLSAFRPDLLLLELPAEFQPWLKWVAHPDTTAPVALAGARGRPSAISFYPFADFSPELAAVRWAEAHGVEVVACDLPISASTHPDTHDDECDPRGACAGLTASLHGRLHIPDDQSLWDRIVEAPAAGSTPEQIRLAGLLFGWMLRKDRETIPMKDRKREAWMRSRIDEHKDRRCAAVVGAFHAPALAPAPILPGETPPDVVEKTGEIPDEKADSDAVACSLIPYDFSLLDERSGYPAGIRDPSWQQGIFESCSPDEQTRFLGRCITAICREMRRRDHQAGSADAIEIMRLCRDLAGLRSLPAPGRRELVESLRSTLAHGDVTGRGRAVARAMETVLVGNRTGSPPPGAPRCGLRIDLEAHLEKLNLPGPDERLDQPKVMRLDPLRSPLDRARLVFLHRLAILEIPYGARGRGGRAGETLTEAWEVRWDERCAAMAAHAALGGVNVAQAAEGTLMRRGRELEKSDRLNPVGLLGLLAPAVAGGLGNLVRSWLVLLFNNLLDEVALEESVTVIKMIERIRRDHEPGLPAEYEDKYGMVRPFQLPPDIRVDRMLQHALRLVEGIHGSERNEDVVSLSDFHHWFGSREERPGSGRWMWLLRNMVKNGSSLMQGAAVMMLDMEGEERLGPALGSWIDSAVCGASRAGLKKRITGALLAGAGAFESCIQAVEEMSGRIAALDDRAFLDRLPALRGGFHCLSPAARERLLKEISITIDPDADRSGRLVDDPGELAALADADAVGFERFSALFPEFTPRAMNFDDRAETGETPEPDTPPAPAGKPLFENPDSMILLADRWKLVLGMHHESDHLPFGVRTANLMLDDIYGMGTGEGAASGVGGGTGGPRPTVREWKEDLARIWDSDVREEVMVEAALHGRGSAILELSPERAVPSVELLESVLSLKGAIPESRMAGLRKLVDRIVSQLVRVLARRMEPALHGLLTQTPRRRRSSRLHLPRTIRANLHNPCKIDGNVQIIPERLYFRARQQRRMDWRLILVVDVSGSMEASVIHSAMMAAIFSRLPALSVQFLAFSTEVIDFTQRVDDPLALLLEVSVGGGTDIGKGLAEARSRIKVPSRTMVVLITDFEEGVSTGRLLDEVSMMSAAGARLLGLASLDAGGKPRWHKGIAERVAAAGMPAAALGPRRVAAWVREQMI